MHFDARSDRRHKVLPCCLLAYKQARRALQAVIYVALRLTPAVLLVGDHVDELVPANRGCLDVQITQAKQQE